MKEDLLGKAMELKEEACWGLCSEDGRGAMPWLCRHRPEDTAKPWREARLPATMKAPPYQSASPRAGGDITPPQEIRSALIINDETSSGFKSAQDLDYSYDCV